MMTCGESLETAVAKGGTQLCVCTGGSATTLPAVCTPSASLPTAPMDACARPLRVSPELGVYAEKHRVFNIIQTMLEKLLVDRPEDTIQYLIDHLKMDNDDVPRILILGPPASGKSTLAKLLSQQLKATHLSRQEFLESAKPLAEEVADAECEDEGQEIPSALWAKLIAERLSEADCIKRGWILEGFPQTRDQALKMQMAGIAPTHVVVLDAPDTVLIERNLGKRVDPIDGDIYHVSFDWPRDPDVQERLTVPDGISEEETGKRLLDYHRNVPGVLDAYKKSNKIINADQPCLDVFSQAVTFVQSRHRSVAPHTPRILLYGPPGSGRSLQAALLAQRYGIVDVCSGQVLKEAVADETKLGELIAPYIERRQPVPDNIVLKVLAQHLSKLESATNGWVLHGFPLDLDQAGLLEDSGFVPNRVFFLDIPDEVAMERLSQRMTDPVTGERYHTIYRPAPTLEVQARLQRNPRDSLESLEQDFEYYHANVQLVEEFYDGVIHINADQDPNTIFEYIESCVINPLPRAGPKDTSSYIYTEDAEPNDY
ncbi:adenylate kinase 8 [Ambystoma mexicanum]|uniref:adenylate kinase 8 n=1 Tax=Ambystoma mexicanum TaxID=8296 RepID=UPI0037E7A706